MQKLLPLCLLALTACSPREDTCPVCSCEIADEHFTVEVTNDNWQNYWTPSVTYEVNENEETTSINRYTNTFTITPLVNILNKADNLSRIKVNFEINENVKIIKNHSIEFVCYLGKETTAKNVNFEIDIKPQNWGACTTTYTILETFTLNYTL